MRCWEKGPEHINWIETPLRWTFGVGRLFGPPAPLRPHLSFPTGNEFNISQKPKLGLVVLSTSALFARTTLRYIRYFDSPPPLLPPVQSVMSATLCGAQLMPAQHTQSPIENDWRGFSLVMFLLERDSVFSFKSPFETRISLFGFGCLFVSLYIFSLIYIILRFCLPTSPRVFCRCDVVIR